MANKEISKAPKPIKPVSTGGYFHKPKPPTIPPANYKTWCRADLWTIERAILLLLNAETLPSKNYYSSGRRNSDVEQVIYDDFMTIWAIAESSLKTGVLKKIGKSYPSLSSEVLPGDFINWARLKGYQIPDELETIYTVTQAETLGEDNASNQATTKPYDSASPWQIADPADPEPKQPWYTPARYFARQLVKEDSTLLTKRDLLTNKVAQSLTSVGIKKRGGKAPLDPATIKKALSNVLLR